MIDSKSNKKNYFCIFPGLINVLLIKDVGLLPYTMGKFFNYNSFIVTYKNDDYNYLKDDLKGNYLKLIFLKKYFNRELQDTLIFLLKNSRKIDVIQFFYLHYTRDLFAYLLIYKILNRKGKVYVKLDADEVIKNYLIGNKGLYGFMQNFMTKYLIDYMSVETYEIYKQLIESNRFSSNKLIYLPNGIYADFNVPTSKKRNYILTVGRLGTKQKATEILLKAFSKIEELNGWNLVLVGEIEESFHEYIKNYFTLNPGLKDKVIFKGHISERNELFKYYSEAKIFCFPSRWESFGIALVEAAYYGNYLLTTDVGGASDILRVTEYGELIKMNDSDGLAERLQELILNWKKYEKNPNEIMKIVKKEFEWKNICKELDKKLNTI